MQPQGPYYLAGFCQETLVALEMAKQLEEQGQRVGSLILIDFVPDHEASISWIARHIRNIRDRGFTYIRDKFKRRFDLSRRHWRHVLLGLGLKHNSRSSRTESKISRNFGLIDHYNEALFEYDVKPIRGPITYIAASEWNYTEPPDWLWAASDEVTLKEVPSCHYDLWEHPQLEYLAAAIHRTLDMAQLVDPELIPLATDDPEDNPQRPD